MGGNNVKYTNDGKWVSPFQKAANGVFTCDLIKPEFEAKGQLYKELNSM